MRNFSRLMLIALCHTSMAVAAEALSDPTRPSGFSEHAASGTNGSEKLSLSLIRLGPEPLAVINGKNIAPGESIAGYRLLSLQTTSATLASSNGRIVLQLAPTIRKSNLNHSSQNR